MIANEISADYLNERISIPDGLRRQFASVQHLPRYRYIETFCEQLGLRCDERAPEVVYEYLHTLSECLAEAVGEVNPRLDNRGVAIADQAAQRFTMEQCLEIAGYYGWLDRAIPKNTTFKMLPRAVRQLVGDGIGPNVNRSLKHWEQLGWLGYAAME